jgi:hypothetical protein
MLRPDRFFSSLDCMNAERAQAYGRLMKTLESLRGAKLHPREDETVREVADALFFCEDLDGDASAQQALSTFHELSDRLLESERMTPEMVHRLTAQVEDCGPLVAVG